MESRRTDSIEVLVGDLVRSGLATDQQASDLVSVYSEVFLASSQLPDTLTAFCTFLVASETVTTWQCEQLRNGKWKGFLLDNFVLLDSLGPDSEFGYFLARNKTDGEVVSLAITPLNRTSSSKIEYRVDRRFK